MCYLFLACKITNKKTETQIVTPFFVNLINQLINPFTSKYCLERFETDDFSHLLDCLACALSCFLGAHLCDFRDVGVVG